MEALRDDVRLSNALQEHAVRVLRVIEKVIVRLEDLEKVSFLRSKYVVGSIHSTITYILAFSNFLEFKLFLFSF